MTLARNLAVTARALSHTTERGARRRGAGFFLPALFADRFSLMGGIDKQVFTDQLAACRTFEDDGWTTYWTALADERIAVVDRHLREQGAPSLAELLTADRDAAAAELGRVFGAAASAFAGAGEAEATEDDASAALAAWIAAITYTFAAAWPGWTPARLEAYRRSRALFEMLLHGLAAPLGVVVEHLDVTVDGHRSSAIVVLPSGDDVVPGVLVSNGLEGTVQELLLPLLRYRDRRLAVVVTEMPGTYLDQVPMSAASSAVYSALIDRMAAHPRIDAGRIAMVGFSFGAHWAARMAALDRRLRAVVANGGLLHRSFRPSAVWGMPEIMLSTLEHTVGAPQPWAMALRLHRLSLRRRYGAITAPMLVINGERDTLASTRDSIDLAEAAPLGELVLYPDDDHCAMGHYHQWLDLTIDWLERQLG